MALIQSGKICQKDGCFILVKEIASSLYDSQ